jgi:hypothetical protein
MQLSPSTSRIYQHLVTAGSISQREAMVEYATGSLTKEITRLRAAGIDIDTIRKTHPITGKRYARYFLKGQAN